MMPAIAVAVLGVAVSGAATCTEGWNNVNPGRREIEPSKLYWEAPFAKGAAAFAVEKREGAEGEVTFSGGAMTIRKTNEKGWIVVTSKDHFTVKADTTLRSFADAEVRGADPFHSVAVPRIFGKREALEADWQLDAVGVFMRGGPKMGNLANTAPGQAERRFASVKATDDFGTNLVPALVVAGAPSTSIWKRWGVEDHDKAAAQWKSYSARHRGVEGRFSQGIPADEYLKRLEGDIDHTARVEKGDGETRLVVDGRIEPPVLYKPNHGWSKEWYRTTGGFLSNEGVRLQTVLMDARECWRKCGFAAGVKMAVDGAIDQMRRAPDALFVVSLRLFVPPEYTAAHPDDVWRNPDGTPVYGNYDKIKNWKDGKPPEGCWPWPSMSSPIWRRDVKSFLEAAICELRKMGLAKRIVGFHICGYHDGQFAPYKPDYSVHGMRAFREWCAKQGRAVPENLPMPICTTDDDFFADTAEGRLKRDFQTFHHLAPYCAQEDFARCAKNAFGKDVVALHWAMDILESTASGSFYLGEFMKSDVMDGLVSQSCYVQRLPSLALGEPFPAASFARHGKLYVDEFDLRTYGLIAGGIGEASAYGLGHSRDFAEWQSVHHRISGIGIARRQGWWYYEISGGFFEPPEIAADIGDVTRLRGEFARQDLRSGWKPSAAFLVDEKGLLARNHICGVGTQGGDRRLVLVQMDRLAASGVPCDVWLAEDAFGDESVVADRKVVVVAGFFDLTEGKAAFVRRLLAKGKTVVLLAGTGAAGGAERLGLKPVFRPSPVSHEVESLTGDGADFRSSFHVEWLRWTLGEKNSPLGVWWRPSCFSFAESPGFASLARYAVDGMAAAVESRAHGGRLVALGEPSGLTPAFFNKLAREAGGYVPVDRGGKLQVDMNGDFISMHALDTGHFDFRLPFPCKVVNLKTGKPVATSDDILPLDLVAGETRWYSLRAAQEKQGH